MTIRVLHVVSELGGGGVERMLLNYYSVLDRKQIQFDFVVHGYREGELEEEFRHLGSEIHRVTPKRESLTRNLRQLFAVIRDGQYDVVQAHQNLANFAPLVIARLLGVQVRISHSHGFPKSSSLRRQISRAMIQWAGNRYVGCTEDAGRWLHPQRWRTPGRDSFVMLNAIDLDRFAFDPKSRGEVRRSLGVADATMILQVGRLSEEKNHSFTLDVLHMISSRARDAVLVVAGAGATESDIVQKASALGLASRVKLIGFAGDVTGLMSAADVLVLPSDREGLGLVAIEAIAAGLPVVASHGVPRDVAVSDRVQFLPLEVEQWGMAIERALTSGRVDDGSAAVRRHGYSIDVAAADYLRYVQAACRQVRGR